MTKVIPAQLAEKYDGMKAAGLTALASGTMKTWNGWGEAPKSRTLFAACLELSWRIAEMHDRLSRVPGLTFIKAETDYISHVTIGQAEGKLVGSVGIMHELVLPTGFQHTFNRCVLMPGGDLLLLGENIPEEVCECRSRWTGMVTAAGLTAMSYDDMYHVSLARITGIDFGQRGVIEEVISEFDANLRAQPLEIGTQFVDVVPTMDFIERLKTEAELLARIASPTAVAA